MEAIAKNVPQWAPTGAPKSGKGSDPRATPKSGKGSDPRATPKSGKEVIQPQVPLGLPCYDFTPVMNHTVVTALRFRLS